MHFEKTRYPIAPVLGPDLSSKSEPDFIPRIQYGNDSINQNRYLGNKAKLQISQTDDTQELEANRAANSIPNVASLRRFTKEASAISRGEETKSSFSNNVLSNIGSNSLGAGDVMSESEPNFFGDHFQENFENIRVHNDSAATEAAQRLQARAFTIGNHIVFGKDEYQPNTHNGRQLFAHELTHVIQQRNQPEAKIQRQPVAGANARPESQGAAYTFIGCTEHEYVILDHVIRQAYSMVRHAHNAILNYILATIQLENSTEYEASRSLTSMQFVLQRDFGARNLSQVSQIRDNLSAMLRKLRSGLVIECHHDAARNQVAEAETPGRKIWVGPRFFNDFTDDLQSRPRVFIHELAHTIGVGHDMSGVSIDAGREGSGVGEFAHHADSYAVLAYRLFTGNLWDGLTLNSDI